MEQVLYNLVYNATVHTPADTTITIHAKHMNSNLILIIEDNGIGFPESDFGDVFGKFYRAKGSKTGGTGLGLSIVKGFIEAHHGSIKLENPPISGARFTIHIYTETSNLTTMKDA